MRSGVSAAGYRLWAWWGRTARAKGTVRGCADPGRRRCKARRRFGVSWEYVELWAWHGRAFGMELALRLWANNAWIVTSR